ncbi:MAG: YIP1 family protein [Calditrichaeota bacterium]|nr:YIP1 family protein [Calditrichota bacterium]
MSDLQNNNESKNFDFPQSTLSETEEEQSIKLSPVEKVIGIFTDPGRVFKALRANPTWLLPLSLIILMTIVFTVVTKDLMIEYRKEVIYDSKRIPEEYKDKAIDQLDNMSPKAYYIQTVGGGVVGIVIVYLLVSGVFLLVGNFVLGGKASFKQVFALYVWGNMVALLEMPVKMVLALAKGSMHVYTSLAIFLDPANSKTVLFQLLNGVDVFAVWKVILWSIGFSIIYRFTRKKSYIAITTLYIIFLLFTVTIGHLFT